MPPKKQGQRAAQKHELEAFAEKYDTLSVMYGDPVEIVFRIMERNFNATIIRKEDGTVEVIAPDDELTLRAANMLMEYRYPRVKAAEKILSQTTPMQFNVIMQAAPAQSLEVRPPQKLVTVKSQ